MLDKLRIAKRSAPARIRIKWRHLIDKDTRQLSVVEHVLIRKVGPLFGDTLEVRGRRPKLYGVIVAARAKRGGEESG